MINEHNMPVCLQHQRDFFYKFNTRIEFNVKECEEFPFRLVDFDEIRD